MDSQDKYVGMATARFLTDENDDGIICRHCDTSWAWSGTDTFIAAGRHYREVHGER